MLCIKFYLSFDFKFKSYPLDSSFFYIQQNKCQVILELKTMKALYKMCDILPNLEVLIISRYRIEGGGLPEKPG